VTLATVRERWRRLGVAPGGSLAWRAVETIRENSSTRPREVVFAGFDIENDAAFQALRQVLRDLGIPVLTFTSDAPEARLRFLRYPSFEDEVRAAARWCRALLEQGESNIGVIIPHLDLMRPVVERVFSDILQPVATRQPEQSHRIAFELSLGHRAVDEPIIAAAFLLLETGRQSLPVGYWTRVLHSPFVRGAEQWSASRVRVDLELRRIGMQRVEGTDLQAAASRIPGAMDDPLLAMSAERIEDHTQRLPSQWAERFRARLDAFGWPGDRSLTSREYQAHARVAELLAEFSALDTVCAALPFVDALGRFRHLVSARIFQVQSTDAPVQIMGVRETAGLRFAHCRILGMNDDVWPPQPRPTAFIPLRLQRRAGVPAASPDRFLAQVRGQTTSLRHLAPEVTFSCSVADGDRLLLPTPLLEDIAVEDRSVDSAGMGIDAADSAQVMGGRGREWLTRHEDHQAPVVTDAEQIRGGTGVLTLQSACPFRAFAVHRLHAARPATVEHGVRLLDRGSLVHAVMEEIWKHLAREVGTDSTQPLACFDDAELHTMIAEATRVAIDRQRSLHGRRIAAHVLDAERECLSRLLVEWFDIERQRAPFQVMAHEQRIETVIAGLRLFVRADRIDRLADGGVAIIDYKSGRKSVDDWMSDRPVEPQIPLYVHTLGDTVRAAAFAVLRRGECRLSGLRDDAADAAEFSPASEYLGAHDPELRNWEDLRHRWTDVLTRLATDFMQGVARVDPRDGADTCAYCELPTLCRIHEMEQGTADDER
jgi:probable DNA repair protein